jgi:hypothetical protein
MGETNQIPQLADAGSGTCGVGRTFPPVRIDRVRIRVPNRHVSVLVRHHLVAFDLCKTHAPGKSSGANSVLASVRFPPAAVAASRVARFVEKEQGVRQDLSS